MLAFLLDKPDQSVSEIAHELKLPQPVASQYLRAMNARGLLQVRRVSRWVYYRVGAADDDAQTKLLLEALRRVIHHDDDATEKIFRLVTAFTHSRRIEIFHALQTGVLSVEQLRSQTGISRHALFRHLEKLEVRGFVEAGAGGYRTTQPTDRLAQVLAQIARS